jgi:hypothetical protein
VKVRDQEGGIVDLIVNRRVGKDDARQASNDEQHEEANEIDNRRGHPDPAAPHRRHPVIDLHACRDADDHRRDPEGDVDPGTLDPMVKKWCSHTVKLMTAMLMLAITSEVYP